ncbi:MAG: ABC-F family ATP-binding cassette domain-containing protein [Prevotella sp.]|nr:ABC-F family ATP-binding cassette domain-containing protein [Prevotella sp.]
MANTQPYIDVKGLTKSFGIRVLFEDISFSIIERQRIGLIARNGTGKSTLLSILTGKESYDSGKIVRRRDLKIGYLEQQPFLEPNSTIIEACFNSEDNEDKLLKAKQILTRLKINDLDEKIENLSGGLKRRVALARVLITEPDMLILDEPTNHLDLSMIEWLEGFLSKGGKTLLMVTHDRFFLDKVSTDILEIDDGKLYQYHGNYAYYLEKRQERLESAKSEALRVNTIYKRELEWMKRMPQARAHKARSREEAFYELEKRARSLIAERELNLKSTDVYIGKKIFYFHGVKKSFSSKVILKDFNYIFSRYEKMGIVGDNGTGKTTFIKMLLGLEAPDLGSIDIGSTVRFGYFSQEGIKLNEGAKVIDFVTDIAEEVNLGAGRTVSSKQFLQHFLFSHEEQSDYIYKLSGGEKRKLQLCCTLMKNPNFLVLDEPTNDLDIQSLNIFEKYLIDFPGCVIIISHDRYFMDKIVDHLLVFKGDGKVDDFPGNYTQYREWLSLCEKEKEKNSPKKESRSKEKPKKERKKLSFKERQEMENLEKDINLLQKERETLEMELSSGNLRGEELTQKSIRLPKVIEELDIKEMRWLELSEIESS